MKQFRQGDLLIIDLECPLTPKSAKNIKECMLLEGESTGHSHTLVGEIERLDFDEAGFQQWLQSIGIEANGICGFAVKGNAILTHQEHEAHVLTPGKYIAVRQREYSPQELRNVQD